MSENEKYNCASEKKDDGGPAFALDCKEFQMGGQFQGSLRDWFAGMALSSGTIVRQANHAKDYLQFNEVAEQMYAIADAMIIERNK